MTDYTGYALVYGCDDWWWFGWYHTKSAWLLTRERTPSNLVAYSDAVVAKFNNDGDDMPEGWDTTWWPSVKIDGY